MTLQAMLQNAVPEGEHILAYIESGRRIGRTRIAVAVTDSRMVLAGRKGLASWEIVAKELLHLPPQFDLYLTEGLLRATITFRRSDGETFLKLKNLPKAYARHFMAIVTERREHVAEDADTRTKPCPDCAEIVKAMARVCRYCGFRF